MSCSWENGIIAVFTGFAFILFNFLLLVTQRITMNVAQIHCIVVDCDIITNIRREVYRILQEEGIDLPRYGVLNRDPDNPEGETIVVF